MTACQRRTRYWPDGTRRSTTTQGGAAGASSQTFHYGTDGNLVNDTTTDSTTGTGSSATASYLITAGREARTLQPGTTGVGTVPDGAPAPVDVGTGTGYLLRDRHSSVTALIDAGGTVTNTYTYSDYGLPALPDGRLQAVPTPTPGGTTNPFQYTGATPISSMLDPTTGLLLLPARSYDPTQGRFTTRDTANVFNKYQGFSTNPIVNVDPTGHFSLSDLLIDIGSLLTFAIVAVATAGAALAAAPLIIGAEVGTVAVSTVVTAVAGAAAAVASATGAVATAVKVADDIDDAVTGKHFLTNDQRSAIGAVQMVAGAVAAVGGLATGGASAAEFITDTGRFAASDLADSTDFLDSDEEYESAGSSSQYDEVNSDDIEDEFDQPRVAAPRAQPRVSASMVDDDAASDSMVDGMSGRASEPQPVTPRASEPIPVQRGGLQDAVGGRDLDASDRAILNADRGLSESLQFDDAAEELSDSLDAMTIRPAPTSPILSATNGNFSAEADLFGAEPNIDDPLSTIDADVRPAIDRFAPYRFSFD